MRVVVVGLGVQGHKRRKFASDDYVGSVDPNNPEADYKSLPDVPLDEYDAVLACVPDAAKAELLAYCVANGKHVLVEKPLLVPAEYDLLNLERRAREKATVIYTAYNHRFEPHYIRMRDLISSGALGRIYSCRMFYGNGTARLVRDSAWRDQGAGVLTDLGSHLLDTCRFWFGDIDANFSVVSASNFENRAADHMVIANQSMHPRVELEMTLLMWRNDFRCDILAQNGTAHISSLCKWGPTKFTHRIRTLPSGRPLEDAQILCREDPTWAAEYAHFKKLCDLGVKTDLSNDLWLHRVLSRLSADTVVRLSKLQ
jgi:scyllo-inositol 2-dehydrogenase (NADP+)